MESTRITPGDERWDVSQLERLLESLFEVAANEGADTCAAIECEDLAFEAPPGDIQEIPAEERSIFWPRVLFPNDSIQNAIRLYRHAVVFRVNIGSHGSLEEEQKKVFKIAGLMESACFYGGYYLSIGLAAGNCRTIFCGSEGGCQALKMGKPCRHPLSVRPSIKACGFDPEEISKTAGWNDYGDKTFLMGMVLID